MTIFATHKYGIEYIEHCAVKAADDQLVFVRRKNAVDQHFNIPVLNTSVLLLGPGTSITQQAARLCSEGNVLLGFSAGGGAPVYMASLNEYREPKYCRNWLKMYEDSAERLSVAKGFQHFRVKSVLASWPKLTELDFAPTAACEKYSKSIDSCETTESLLLAEALFAKSLYAQLAKHFGKPFSRKPRTSEFANEFLDSGNYLAYGLAACCLWILGIPHSYPVMHGKTRRGALVFDIADLIKDSYIMPNAFISAALGESASEARRRMLTVLHDSEALRQLFDCVLEVASVERP